MVATAQRRIKASFSTIRFFEMNSLDIGRFLKASSFNIIACVDNTLPYLGDRTLVRKFFHDTKKLLAPGGFLLLHVYNFGPDGENSSIMLPERSSIRVNSTANLFRTEPVRFCWTHNWNWETDKLYNCSNQRIFCRFRYQKSSSIPGKRVSPEQPPLAGMVKSRFLRRTRLRPSSASRKARATGSATSRQRAACG